ncbi:uncharacterized protein LOC113210611 [Frankliniella occidentalis]|uniref:Uncharacterized protein LOC113210611 n=1 Tax=Frankliniella occidentalis TaxID=133901 RepID=A0A9C6WSY4_FRAOC|nr:uncharacterized protein LOC113210611 [Frankliniella occidentalis]
MDQLLDDVLVLVMTRLSVEDVFTCRLVCKRLAALALHPDVWRNRVFKNLRMGRGKCLLCPVLRLAPSLRTLALRMCSYDTTPHRSREITCGVRKLRLSVDPAGVELAVYFIRRFAALGRLRVICLDWDTFEHAYEDDMWPAAAPEAVRPGQAAELAGAEITPAPGPGPGVGGRRQEPARRRPNSVCRGGLAPRTEMAAAGRELERSA